MEYILIAVQETIPVEKFPVCQWPTTGRWFSSGIPVSSTNKNKRHDITEILLTVALNTQTQYTGTNEIVIMCGSMYYP
jgi:hypothetical protein